MTLRTIRAWDQAETGAGRLSGGCVESWEGVINSEPMVVESAPMMVGEIPGLAAGTELIGEYPGSGFSQPRYLTCRANEQILRQGHRQARLRMAGPHHRPPPSPQTTIIQTTSASRPTTSPGSTTLTGRSKRESLGIATSRTHNAPSQSASRCLTPPVAHYCTAKHYE